MILKKLNPLMICHMVLMVLLLGFSLFSAVVLIGGIGIPPEVFTGREKTVIQLRGIFNIVNISAICCGIVYLWNEYSVKAEVYYKIGLWQEH